MKIEYLYEFLDLVETMNYSLSASRLYISQPTLSRHIKAMEKELGFPLFNTTSHGISLTRTGELAVHSFRKIVREYDRYLAQCENMSMQVTGTLRIGFLYYSMDDFFSPFLEKMEEKYPHVKFVISNYQPQALYDDLQNGKIDVGSLVFYDIKQHKDLRLQQISTQGTLAIMRNDHVLSSAETVTLEELAFSKLIFLKNDPYSNEITGELLSMKTIHFPDVIYSDNIETVPQTVRRTGGIHLTGESCKKQNASGICYKDVAGPGTRSSFCLAALPTNDNPLINILFREAEEFYKAAALFHALEIPHTLY